MDDLFEAVGEYLEARRFWRSRRWLSDLHNNDRAQELLREAKERLNRARSALRMKYAEEDCRRFKASMGEREWPGYP